MKSFARALAEVAETPVQISLVITDLNVGGAERALVSLATGLDRRRWTPSVICLDREGELAGPLRSAGITVTCLSVDRCRPISAVARLVSALKRDPPALIQSFLFHANIAARLASPWVGRPVVVGGLRVAEHAKGWHLRLDRLTQGLSACSVCVSEGVKRHAIEAGRLEPRRLVVIPNGVDVHAFDDAAAVELASWNLGESEKVLLYVGRIDAQKAVNILIQAAALVAKQRTDWRLLIAGDGPERDRLEALTISFAELSGRVEWLGRRGDVPSLLKTADAMILPSLWEGMPNVILEAMAARRPVIATQVEGTEELVEPGKTGWLVPPGDPRSLASAILEALADPERLRRLGEAGRSRVEAEYTPQRVVQSYERLWAGLLGMPL